MLKVYKIKNNTKEFFDGYFTTMKAAKQGISKNIETIANYSIIKNELTNLNVIRLNLKNGELFEFIETVKE